MRISLEFRNYRCFSDESPLTLNLESGFTCLIGPNNSGKSTALRAIYEFRPVFQKIAPLNELVGMYGSPGGIATPLQGVADIEQCFHDGNKRPLSVRLILDPDDTAPTYQLSGHRVLELLCDRESKRWIVNIDGRNSRGSRTGVGLNENGLTVGSEGIDLRAFYKAREILERYRYLEENNRDRSN